MERITELETKYYRKLNSETDFRYNMDQAIAFTLTRLEDGWDKVTYYGESWIDPTNSVHKPHYIYVLVNPSVPGICKIGYTTTTVYDRCRQINTATGVVVPWYPVFAYKCPSGPMLERDIHTHLEKLGKRVNLKREGFEISSIDAIKIIENIGESYKNTKENE